MVSYNFLTNNRCEPNMLIFCYTWVCARPRLLFSASKIGQLAVIPATKKHVHYLDLSWWLLDTRSFGKKSYTLFGSWKIQFIFLLVAISIGNRFFSCCGLQLWEPRIPWWMWFYHPRPSSRKRLRSCTIRRGHRSWNCKFIHSGEFMDNYPQMNTTWRMILDPWCHQWFRLKSVSCHGRSFSHQRCAMEERPGASRRSSLSLSGVTFGFKGKFLVQKISYFDKRLKSIALPSGNFT